MGTITIGGASGGGSKGFFDYRHAGNWYANPFQTGAVTTLVLPGGGNLAVAIPFMGSNASLDGLAINVSTAAGAGALGRLGLYSVLGPRNLYPGDKLVESSTFAIDSTGDKLNNVGPYAMTEGAFYWLVLSYTAQAFLRSFTTGVAWSALGATGGNLQFNPWYIWKSAHANFSGAALPATFPAGATQSNEIPIIFTRVAA